jgi:hypothetical protein
LTCSHGSRFADHYDDFLQPMLLSAHPLAQSNYGDNKCMHMLQRVDERRFDLILFLEGHLVVARVVIEEGE